MDSTSQQLAKVSVELTKIPTFLETEAFRAAHLGRDLYLPTPATKTILIELRGLCLLLMQDGVYFQCALRP
jgi:hypothetical protein